ncbi:MAG TPA: hypothetical protein VIX12_03725 [Candidatus Binataceae bacterium]
MSAVAGYPVRAPRWVLTYQGVNITGDVSQMVTEITYVDRLGDACGELEIELDDHDGRWQGSWYPSLGDRANLLIGYHGEELLPCGDFQVDELELAGPPDRFRMRCLAAYVTPALRTENSAGYENLTLLQIAAVIAGKYGLTLMSATGVEDLSFTRVTQKQETDLGFLKRLANQFDYDFNVRGATMVMFARTALEQTAPVFTIAPGGVERYEFRNKTRRIYAGAQAAYQDPFARQLIVQSVESQPPAPTGDTLKLVSRCENGQQARLKAAAALHRHNLAFTTISLTMPGTTLAASGSTAAVQGWSSLDGTYLIELARHHLDRATGYTTEIEARLVQ